MDPKDEAKLHELTAACALLEAKFEALLLVCEELARRQSTPEIDDLPVAEWVRREQERRMETILVKMEDRNPALAALLQKLVDDAREQDGKAPPGDGPAAEK